MSNQPSFTVNTKGLALFDRPRINARLVEVKLGLDLLKQSFNKLRRGNVDKAIECGYSRDAIDEIERHRRQYEDLDKRTQDSMKTCQFLLQEQDKIVELDKVTKESLTHSADFVQATQPRVQEIAADMIKTMMSQPHDFVTLLTALGPSLPPAIKDELEKILSKAASQRDGDNDSVVQCTQLDHLSQGIRDLAGGQTQLQLVERVAALEQSIRDAEEDVGAKMCRIDALVQERDRQDASLAKHEARRAETDKERAQDKQEIDRLKREIATAARERAQLELQLEDHDRCEPAIADLQGQVESLRLKVDVLELSEATLQDEVGELRRKNGDLESLRKDNAELPVLRSKISDLHAERDNMIDEVKDLRSHNAVIPTLRQEIENLRDENDEQANEMGELRTNHAVNLTLRREIADLRAKNASLRQSEADFEQELTTASGRVEELANTIETQKAKMQKLEKLGAFFIQVLSLGFKSPIWKQVFYAFCENPRLDMGNKPYSVASTWKLLPSWSDDRTLSVMSDFHGFNCIALDCIASLAEDSPASQFALLLSRLTALPGALGESSVPFSRAIANLLVEAMEKALQDPRMHLLHRVVMIQVIALLMHRWPSTDMNRRLDGIIDILKAADPKAYAVAEALRADDIEAKLASLGLSPIRYEDRGIILVGFEMEPPGVLMLRFNPRNMRWIDNDRIKASLTELELSSSSGEITSLPFDQPDKIRWHWYNVGCESN